MVSSSPAYRIFLADDHVVVREALANLIEALGPYRVEAQFSDGRSLLQGLEAAAGNSPDLVLLDLSMPVMNGADVMRALHVREAYFPVMVLSNEVAPEAIRMLVRLGARGYLPKACTAAELRQALQTFFQTGYYHSELEHSALRGTDGQAQATHLAPRELEFLRLVCHRDELSYKQIAAAMDISERTVDGYRESLFRKCGVKTKVGLVFFALKQGLVALGDV